VSTSKSIADCDGANAIPMFIEQTNFGRTNQFVGAVLVSCRTSILRMQKPLSCQVLEKQLRSRLEVSSQFYPLAFVTAVVGTTGRRSAQRPRISCKDAFDGRSAFDQRPRGLVSCIRMLGVALQRRDAHGARSHFLSSSSPITGPSSRGSCGLHA